MSQASRTFGVVYAYFKNLQIARPAIPSIESSVIEFLEKLILHSSASKLQEGENEKASALKNKIKLDLVSRSNRSLTKWFHSTFLTLVLMRFT